MRLWALSGVLLALLWPLTTVEPAHAGPAPDSAPGCIYETSPPTLNDQGLSRLHCDNQGTLKITGSITATNPSVGVTGAAAPTSATLIGATNGGNLVGLTADGSNNLNVNCAVGCASGSFNNNADAVATSATNGQSAAWLYAFNGATFDRLRVDASKNLQVNINASSATVPISALSLPLPTGAATAAKQPAIGTAGTASADVLTIQGIAGMTAVVVSGTVTANAGTNLNTSLLALETGGNLATLAGGVTASVYQTNEKQINGVVPLMGNGVSGTGAQRVVIASDNTAFSVNATDNLTQIAGGSTGLNGDVNNAVAVTNTLDVVPVGRYNSTLPTITNTQYNSLQVGQRGSLNVQLLANDSTVGIGSGSAYADAASNTQGHLNTAGFNFLYNTSTWDRAQGVSGQAFSIIRDAANNGRGANVNASNQLSVSLDGGTGSTVTVGAGTNICCKVGIDQTTDITTNGVEIAPTSGSAAAIAPTVSASAEGTHAFKASAGNLYSVEVSATAAGLLMIFDATSAPVDGAVTPKHCYFIAANQSFARDWSPMPERYATGISVAYSSGTNCFNKTASAVALFSADFK